LAVRELSSSPYSRPFQVDFSTPAVGFAVFDAPAKFRV